MLKITVGEEYYDEGNEEFFINGEYVLELEHSLAALSKWESKWKKPFLDSNEKTTEEVLSYIECMILSPYFPPEVFQKLSKKNFEEIHAYIDDKMTATWFNEIAPETKSTETITSELVYYWMFSAGIPMECENWHLNRLFTLIKVYGLKNSKPKKMSRGEIAARNRELNEKRRRELGTSG